MPFSFDLGITCHLGLQDLKDYMRQAGEVTYADAHKQHRNEGYVSINFLHIDSIGGFSTNIFLVHPIYYVLNSCFYL